MTTDECDHVGSRRFWERVQFIEQIERVDEDAAVYHSRLLAQDYDMDLLDLTKFVKESTE